MGFNSLIDRSLMAAMTAMKDLVTTGTITRKAASGYSFQNKTANVAESSIGTVRLVIDEKKQKGGTIKFSAIIMVAEVPFPISDYDILTVDGSNWRFGHIPVKSGRIILAELFKVT